MPALINYTSDTQSTASAGGITSASVTAPSGTTTGDLIVVIVCIEHFSRTNTVTPPAGFTQVDMNDAGSNPTSYASQNTGGQWIFYKVLSSPASGSYTFTFGTGTYYSALFAFALSADFVATAPVNVSPDAYLDLKSGTSYVLPALSYYIGVWDIHRASANPVATIYTQMNPALWNIQLTDGYSGSANFNDHVQFLVGFYDCSAASGHLTGGNDQGTGAIASSTTPGTHYMGTLTGFGIGTRPPALFSNIDHTLAKGLRVGLSVGME